MLICEITLLPGPWIIVTLPSPFKPNSVVLPVAVLIVAMFSFQIGAVVAKQLFPVVGATGATALRLGLSSVILLVGWRPWRIRLSWGEARSIVIYGLAMGLMNLFFYSSLNRIPLGIAVALEFTGPLAVAMASSRSPIDFVWIALAAFGLIALLPLGLESRPLDSVGIGFALAAGVCWAIYIVFGQKAGNAHGGQTTALGTLVGAILIVPLGIGQAGMALLSPSILPAACAVALLSTALPYSLEMYALTRLPTRTFGVLMSGDPALGAVSGLIFLGEKLSSIQWAAIASIMLASAGSAYTSRRSLQSSLPD
jgi:inner membrane transporter RhtA